jgi:ABC-2 type transport system permease protein
MKQPWHPKVWLVFKQEYTHHVFTWRFLMGMLSLPLLLLLMGGVVFILVVLELDTTPVGYVDHSGLLAQPVYPSSNVLMPLQAYEDETQAHQALEAGTIQAYYVLEAGYLQSGASRLVYRERPSNIVQAEFEDFIATNLLVGQPEAVVRRAVQGSDISVSTADGSRTFSEDGWVNIAVPFAISMALILTLFSSSGYLLQAVVEEKENRTMEIILTSVSTGQLMLGKTLAGISAGLTQLAGWLVFTGLGLFLIRDELQVELAPGMLSLAALVFFPSLVMLSGIMTAVGATVTEAREGQQVVGLISMFIWLPFMLVAFFMFSPNSPAAVGLSLFPLTAPVSLLFRAAFTVIPTWQSATSVILQWLAALGALWLAGRALRLGLLNYGKRISLVALFRHGKRQVTTRGEGQNRGHTDE